MNFLRIISFYLLFVKVVLIVIITIVFWNFGGAGATRRKKKLNYQLLLSMDIAELSLI